MRQYLPEVRAHHIFAMISLAAFAMLLPPSTYAQSGSKQANGIRVESNSLEHGGIFNQGDKNRIGGLLSGLHCRYEKMGQRKRRDQINF